MIGDGCVNMFVLHQVISFNMELMLGHLPRRVAHHLSVLLDKSLVQIKVRDI